MSAGSAMQGLPLTEIWKVLRAVLDIQCYVSTVPALLIIPPYSPGTAGCALPQYNQVADRYSRSAQFRPYCQYSA